MEKNHSETIKGLALVVCSFLLFPVSLDLMQDHDDAMNDYDRAVSYTHLTLPTKA